MDLMIYTTKPCAETPTTVEIFLTIIITCARMIIFFCYDESENNRTDNRNDNNNACNTMVTTVRIITKGGNNPNMIVMNMNNVGPKKSLQEIYEQMGDSDDEDEFSTGPSDIKKNMMNMNNQQNGNANNNNNDANNNFNGCYNNNNQYNNNGPNWWIQQ